MIVIAVRDTAGTSYVETRKPPNGISGGFHDSYGICLPPYQNTIGEREPSIWAGPCEPNFHSYGGWCPVSYGILVGGRLLP